jgi:hypothetical protein
MTLRLSALRRVKIARNCLFKRYLWKKMAEIQKRRMIVMGNVVRKRIHLLGIFRIHH